MLKDMKIAARLILIGSMLILIPLVIVGTIAINRASVGLKSATNEQLASRSRGVAKLVETILQDQLRLVIELSTSPDVNQAAEAVSRDGIDGAEAELGLLTNHLKKILKSRNKYSGHWVG